MFRFGVDYYPEHWPQERWSLDAQWMAEAGFNVARLAEFAWSKMEPQEGQYDFEWLDRAISILDAHGMQIILGTPTASPPPWVMAAHPDAFLVAEDGHRTTFGCRREYCLNNPAYQEHTHRIVTRMAEHYADNPAVIGWQIDNELGDRCYCPVCTAAFHEWLRQRYGSLDELNSKWGTIFWSHVYTDWSQIPAPLKTGGSHNPGLALDYYRFCSDSHVTYQKMQADVLRAKCPSHFVTHNLMGINFSKLNYHDLARDLDFVSWDNYLRTQWAMTAQEDPAYTGLGHDCMRGLKHKSFWVMEQQAGPGGWEIVSMTPRPGELRLWAYQAIAHGADGILFFRWRTARFGTEEYWHGLLDHDGTLTRRYQEIKQMGAEIKQAGETILGSEVRAPIAILHDYDTRFAFQVQQNNPQFDYVGITCQYYRAFYQRQIAIDVVSPQADLSAYKLVVAPALHVVSEEMAENLKRFVRGGGVLVVTMRSGVKDVYNTVVNQRLPGLLAELCGVEVEEYDSLASEVQNGIEFTIPELAVSHPPTAKVWCDVLKPTTATIIGRYTSDYYAGKPAITLNQYGQGKVLYVGTMGDDALYELLARWLLNMAGVRRTWSMPPGVEAAERWQGDRRLLFVLNHTEHEQEITLGEAYVSLIDGTETLGGTIPIAPHEVLVLMEK